MTLGILSLFTPSLCAAAATLHIAFDDQETPGGEQLMVFLHGHSHTGATPDHEHPLFRSVPQVGAGATPSLVLKLRFTTVEVVQRTPSSSILAGRFDSASGNGPPGDRVPLPLRV